MSLKTVFIILISVLVTVILMNNTDEMDFWIFGEARIPKLTVLGSMFGLGLIFGFLIGRPRKKIIVAPYEEEKGLEKNHQDTIVDTSLSDEDRDYIR